MNEHEDITLFDETEETLVIVDPAASYPTKRSIENKNDLATDSITEPQIFKQDPFLINAFLQPYELFWKGYAVFFLSLYSRHVNPF